MPSHFTIESPDNWLNTHMSDRCWPITILLIGRDCQWHGQRALAGHLSYWEQLKETSLYSLERRRERYQVIYLWWILEGQVPNFSGTDSEIKSRWHQRRGRYCQVPHVGRSGTTAAQNLRLSSFAVHAPRLFNSLPDYIRNTTDCSLNVFKGLLDKFLASVPDEPLICGYTAYRRADTNSLLDMVRFATAQSLPGLEEPDNISDAGGGHPWSP